MNALILTLLGAIVRIAGIEHMRLAVHRYVKALLLGILAFILAMIALVYGLGAIWFFLLPIVGPVYAYLIIGGVLALTSAISAFAARGALGGRDGSKVKPPLPAMPGIHGGRFSGNGISELASAAIAGFIAGLLQRKR